MATMVKQAQLQDVLDKRSLVSDLKKALKQAEDELLALELVTIGGLEKGAPVEKGPLNGVIEEKPGQRRPAWKDHFAAYAGPVEVQRVIDATPYGPATKHLVVTEKGQVRK